MTVNVKKRPRKTGHDKRRKLPRIEAAYFEQISTADIAAFISSQVQSRRLAPKTANRYREILCRLFNWSMEQREVKMPNGKNPAAAVERYKEKASEIRFLTIQQIGEQLNALADQPPLQAMVAMLIYAGLRREELLWLTTDDVDLSIAPHGMIRIRAKTVDGEHWQPKTKVNRIVPISRTLRGYLDAYRPPKTSGRWFFPSPNGGLQVGYAIVGGVAHASLWNGSAASWVDLHPVSATESLILGADGGQQVGGATVGGVTHASLWNGTAASWVDLSAFLPPGFGDNVALGISSDGANIYITGYGFNTVTSRNEALLWTQPIPEPGSVVLLGLGGLMAVGVRRRRR